MSKNEERLARLLEKANSLPLCPGVYIMKNVSDKVIYVGKSRKLKNRVSQYFQNSEKNLKTARMVSLVDHFDYYVCNTEIEALALENTLIKKYTPKYNIRLKDAKSYPYIKITNEEYPRILFTRSRLNDKAKYFGPYTGTSTVFSVLGMLHRNMGIPSCNRKFPRDFGKERPCIYYQMKQCCGLCTGNVSREEYDVLVRSAADVLRGNTAKVRRQIEQKMYSYAENEQFEAAIGCRETIKALERLSEKQKIIADPDVNHDVIGFYVGDTATAFSVLNIRNGAMINKTDQVFGADKFLDENTITTFLYEYYRGKEDIPSTILLSADIDEEELALISDYLSGISGYRVEVRVPERGDKKSLCVIADNNASQAALQYVSEMEKSDDILAGLAGILGLEALPSRIESYDISNLGSENKTAGMVVCEDGKMKHSDYRTFRIKDVDGTDDYACMREAIRRRFSHISDVSGAFSVIPDLILLDGGRGHVAVVREELFSLGIEVPVFGMVKDDFHKTRALCDEENEISIAHDQKIFVFLYKLQEEVHRFTIGKMSSAKRKALRTSSLEKIEGIGAKKASLLLSSFGTIEAIRKAEIEELELVKGISHNEAVNVYRYFRKDKE